jgi:hypothetical protein
MGWRYMAIGFETSINNEAVRYSSGLDLFEGRYLARFEKSYYSLFGKI